MIRSYPFIPVAAFLAASAFPAAAQVPHLLSYQGRLKVSGADYSGTGQFKFALVSASGAVSYWSNDGTSAGGSQPSAAVSLPVQAGLYTVQLGDATLPNMTALGASVFSNSDVHLRVWFSDGANGWQQLTPDQRVAAVGYALMADNVKDGAITTGKLADGAVTAGKIGAGAVTAAALSPTAITDSLNATGQGLVPPGTTLISPVQNAPGLLAAGYQPAGSLSAADSWKSIQGGTARDRAASVWTGTEMLIWGDGAEGWRYNPSTNIWTAMATENQPVNRENPVAVWTGSEMIVWGGRNGTTYYNSGGRYNPATNTWVTMSNTAPPTARYDATAVWTGTEMLIFGGYNGGYVADPARYNPSAGVAGTWTGITAANPPSARQTHRAVWTGTEMIIHGGHNNATLQDCYRFNPAGAGTWTAAAQGIVPRHGHSMVWTGNAVLVWGGTVLNATDTYASGASYQPSSNTWMALSTTGAPERRFQHAAVWTGSEMIIWGGTSSAVAFVYAQAGARYNPVTTIWTAMGTTGGPAPRVYPNMHWTGGELLIWGGSNGSGLDQGARYSPGSTLYLYQKP